MLPQSLWSLDHQLLLPHGRPLVTLQKKREKWARDQRVLRRERLSARHSNHLPKSLNNEVPTEKEYLLYVLQRYWGKEVSKASICNPPSYWARGTYLWITPLFGILRRANMVFCLNAWRRPFFFSKICTSFNLYESVKCSYHLKETSPRCTLNFLLLWIPRKLLQMLTFNNPVACASSFCC